MNINVYNTWCSRPCEHKDGECATKDGALPYSLAARIPNAVAALVVTRHVDHNPSPPVYAVRGGGVAAMYVWSEVYVSDLVYEAARAIGAVTEISVDCDGDVLCIDVAEELVPAPQPVQVNYTGEVIGGVRFPW